MGAWIRRERKAQGLIQPELAGLADMGVRFLSELENGKPTAELRRTLRVLHELGLDVALQPRGRR